MILPLFLAWWSVGLFSFLYWWTNDHDAGIDVVVLGVFLAFMGPLNWAIGWVIHGHSKNERVIFRKRKCIT